MESNKNIDNRDFRFSVTNNYPYPIAMAYNRLMNQCEHPMEKFFGIIDTAEAITHFISTISLWEHLSNKEKIKSETNYNIFKELSYCLSFGNFQKIISITHKDSNKIKFLDPVLVQILE